MTKKLPFNILGEIDQPTLILQNKNFDNYGAIVYYTNLVYNHKFNSADGISFKVYKRNGGKINPLWDQIVDSRIIYIPEIDQRFEISITWTVSDTSSKTVTGKPLAESELSNILLRDVEINTEIDITNKEYLLDIPTIFYRPLDDEYVNSFADSVWNNSEKYDISKFVGSTDEETMEIRRNYVRKGSLLHRIIEKAGNYSISHVDSTLLELSWIRNFSFNKKSIHDALTSEIADEFGVLFQFDKDRKVYVYDLYNTCESCGYRGDFDIQCPNIIAHNMCSNCGTRGPVLGERAEFTEETIEDTKTRAKKIVYKCKTCNSLDTSYYQSRVCGHDKYHGQYGEDTTIVISDVNVAKELVKQGDFSSVKTQFKVEGADDLINAAIAASTPSSNGYIFSIPDYMLDDMPEEMVDKIKEYQELYVMHQYNKSYEITEAFIDKYNTIIDYCSKYYKEELFNKRTSPVFGYNQLTGFYYDLIELESVLRYSLLPTVETDHPSIEETAAKVLSELQRVPIGVNRINTTASVVENAISSYLKTFVNTSLYRIEISQDSIYEKIDDENGTWSGTIELIEIEVEKNEQPKTVFISFGIPESTTCYSSNSPITVTSDPLPFLSQKIKKMMSKADLINILDLTNMDHDITDLSKSVTVNDTVYNNYREFFKEALHYYSSSYLTALNENISGISAIISELRDKLNTAGSVSDYFVNGEKVTPVEYYYNQYYERMVLIEEESTFRSRQLEDLYKLYNYDVDKNIESGEIPELRNAVKEELDFEKWLGEYYPTFCAYLKEDTYDNPNYSSVGLNNAELVQRAQELIAKATQELEKASYLKYTIDSTLNNLLVIQGFAPLRDKFEVGNWLRVVMEDEVHKLRLMEYEIDFDDIGNISVEFSELIHTPSYSSDVKSILESASSIAGSYSSFRQQMNKTTDKVEKIDSSIQEGNLHFSNNIDDEITFGPTGILGRSYDYETNDYEPYQWRFVRNGLYFTSDGWKTVSNALGKIQYEDAEGNTQVGYGLLAENVIGNLIMGKNLVIKNNDNTFLVNEDGLVSNNSETGISISISPNKDDILNITNKDNDIIMNVTSEGNAYFSGAISTSNGNIGEWIINENSISHGDFGTSGGAVISIGTTESASIGGSDEIDGWVLAMGENFGVTNEGIMYAKDALLSGTITAEDGKIGGFNITESSLYNGTDRLSINGDSMQDGIYIGTDGITFAKNNHITITEKDYEAGTEEEKEYDTLSLTTIKNGLFEIQYIQDISSYLSSDEETRSNYDRTFFIDESGAINIIDYGYNSIDGSNQHKMVMNGTHIRWGSDDFWNAYNSEYDGENTTYTVIAENIINTGYITASSIVATKGTLGYGGDIFADGDIRTNEGTLYSNAVSTNTVYTNSIESTGDIAITSSEKRFYVANKSGLWLNDSDTGSVFPLIHWNGSNIWVGATSTDASSHLGHLMLDSGAEESSKVQISRYNNSLEKHNYEVMDRGFIQSGIHNCENIAANTIYTATIKFPQTFWSDPNVVATLQGSYNSTNISNIHISVNNINLTGFQIRIYNNNSAAISPSIHWIAMYQR